MSDPGKPPSREQNVGTSGRAKARKTSLFAHGEPMVWLTGGALALSLFMVIGLLLLVFAQGASTFWPGELVAVKTADGKECLGEVTRDEEFTPTSDEMNALPEDAWLRAYLEVLWGDHLAERRLLRTGNFDVTGTHFNWVRSYMIEEESRPEWGLLFERRKGGRFYGYPAGFVVDGETIATEPDRVWAKYEEHIEEVADRWEEREDLGDEIGDLNKELRNSEKDVQELESELESDDDPEGEAAEELREAREKHARLAERTLAELSRLAGKQQALDHENERYAIVVRTAGGVEKHISLADVVRAYAPNQLGFLDKVGVYLSRWWEFLTGEPREANSEGGVWPAIFCTVVMTLIMCIMVVPFGVLAALYLREYAKAGPLVSAVRIAINNLAGVPSIVFGVFGLGFFCYIVGAGIDEIFYRVDLLDGSPTYGKGGLLWASLTLALLTLPVVIVATEEALAAVPSSMREGSYACGASKWQTIKRIVLPRAMPGIMTGMILAMARGAGEVAPLMLVGAVKLAPELPVDFGDMSGSFAGVPLGPLHPDRSFMHLGFHIYDVGFQSQNSEAAKPMVFTTTLLLITMVVLLNVVAIWIRGKLRRRFGGGHF